jgi:hypothetical protein
VRSSAVLRREMAAMSVLVAEGKIAIGMRVGEYDGNVK